MRPPIATLRKQKALAQAFAAMHDSASARPVIGNALFCEEPNHAVDVIFVDSLTESRQGVRDLHSVDELGYGMP